MSIYIQVSHFILVSGVLTYPFEDRQEPEANSATAQQDDIAPPIIDSTQTQTHVPVQPVEIHLPGGPEHGDDLRDHPERDYYTQSPWVQDFIAFIILDMVGSTIKILELNVLIKSDGLESSPMWLYLLYPLPDPGQILLIAQAMGLHLFVLFSTLIEDFSLYTGRRLNSRARQRNVKILKILKTTLFIALLYVEVSPVVYPYSFTTGHTSWCVWAKSFSKIGASKMLMLVASKTGLVIYCPSTHLSSTRLSFARVLCHMWLARGGTLDRE